MSYDFFDRLARSCEEDLFVAADEASIEEQILLIKQMLLGLKVHWKMNAHDTDSGSGDDLTL
jgi:hypothetical protein